MIEIEKAESGITKMESDIFSDKEDKPAAQVTPPVASPSGGSASLPPVQEAQAETPAPVTEVAKEVVPEKQNKAVWQFRYRRYRFVTDVLDETSSVVASSGKKPNRVIKARNWRMPLDLDIPADKALHESLLRSPQCGAEFMLLRESDKGSAELPERAQTLKRLWDMPTDQLVGMLDEDDKQKAGIVSGVDPNREELIIAIIDAKKFIGGNI